MQTKAIVKFADRARDRQGHRQTEPETDRARDRQGHRQTLPQTDRARDSLRESELVTV